jgi:tRNA threonylcarbamoyladenosine biosynthesis protein TsaE
VDGHVGHVTVKSVVQPGQKARFGARKIDTGHSYLGESELTGPLADSIGLQGKIVLTAVERHLPILENAPTGGPALLWRSESDTRAFAQKLADHPLVANAFIELRGDLGAGKTTFTRFLLQALGVEGRIKSPTYTVVEPHEAAGFPAWHFDFYRFGDPREWEDAGLRDIFASPGLKIAEWPEKAAGLLPLADLVIAIEAQADESRRVTLTAGTERGRELLS